MKKQILSDIGILRPKTGKTEEKSTKILHLEIRRREKMFFYCLKTEKKRAETKSTL